MEADRALDGLSARVERILGILAEGRKSLAVPEASEWKALALRRWEMLRALKDFIAYKETHILDPVRGCDEAALGRRADEIASENEDLQSSYDAFVRHWALNNPIAADAPYRAAALKMAGRIERQVISDIQEIEALLRVAPAAATIPEERPGREGDRTEIAEPPERVTPSP